jgi:hypothetical protein
MALSVTNFTDQAIILVENIPAENSQINLWKRLIMAMYKDGYKNSDGYEYREGCWHKDDKDYDYGKDGKYHEYTHDYKNDEGYQYWGGSYHKGGKDYDYDYGKYVEHTDSHASGDYHLSTEYPADHAY